MNGYEDQRRIVVARPSGAGDEIEVDPDEVINPEATEPLPGVV